MNNCLHFQGFASRNSIAETLTVSRPFEFIKFKDNSINLESF